MANLEFSEETLAFIKMARTAAESAYCPYSKFPVGAAVETDIGVFVGCNIENASYGLALCAERVALFTAVAAGAKRLIRLAVSCLNVEASDPTGGKMPCGACRQVIAEFMTPESLVLVDGAGSWTVRELLPEAFQLAANPFLSGERK